MGESVVEVEEGGGGQLGLTTAHRAEVVTFMSFSRRQRGQRLRAVDACFEETQRARLAKETTFTRDEVAAVLASLRQAVLAEFHSELINAAHTAVLLLRQLCLQADHYRLRLFTDLSEIEDRALLDAVGAFETLALGDERQSHEGDGKSATLMTKSAGGGAVKSSPPPSTTTSRTSGGGEESTASVAAAAVDMKSGGASLSVLDEQGGDSIVVLKQELDRLKTENEQLKKAVKSAPPPAAAAIEQQLDQSGPRPTVDHSEAVSAAPCKEELRQVAEEKAALTRRVENIQANMGNSDADRKAAEDAIEQLREQMAVLGGRIKANREDGVKSRLAEAQYQKELSDSHERLLQVREQLYAAEKELEKKFSQTAAYKNLKSMLNKKNQQIRDYRTKLAKFEPIDGGVNEDD